MTTKKAQARPWEIFPGIQPSTDCTPFATKHYVMSDKVRIDKGWPEKIGGWQSIPFTSSNVIRGKARSMYSISIDAQVRTIIGTNTGLYSLYGPVLTQVTPLQSGTTAAANSLATHYATLANNPFTFVNGSRDVVVADTEASKFFTGDIYTLSGAAGTINGVPAANFNTSHIVRAIGTNTITIRVATAATSSGTGGGAAIVRSSGLITVTSAAHGMFNDDRVKVNAAVAAGGITAPQLNLEFNIRNVATNTFDIVTAGTATSSVSAAGGASTTYNKQLADGPADEVFGQGYGSGLYGAGLYGTALVSTSGRILPRIWYLDRFGEIIIANPGNQSGVYEWNGGLTTAPVLVTNAPTAVNYAFVSDNVLVTFGAGGILNKIFASDQGDRTQWTASSTNQVFEDVIEGIGRLLSHVPVRGSNLIFTETSVDTFRKISKDAGVWEIKPVDRTIGIIGSMARCSVKGIGYWMGADNFYMYRGGNAEVIPSNSGPASTIRNYVFNDLNYGQKSKCFAWYNTEFDEVWFHYPSAVSNEPDRIARVCLTDFSWTMDTMDRLCAEYPNALLTYPRLINEAGIPFYHEVGSDDDGVAMPFSLTTNQFFSGKDIGFVAAFVPDSTQEGSVNVNVASKLWPQSAANVVSTTYTSTTDRVPTAVSGRFVQYTIFSGVIGQSWRMGQWYDEIQAQGSA